MLRRDASQASPGLGAEDVDDVVYLGVAMGAHEGLSNEGMGEEESSDRPLRESGEDQAIAVCEVNPRRCNPVRRFCRPRPGYPPFPVARVVHVILQAAGG